MKRSTFNQYISFAEQNNGLALINWPEELNNERVIKFILDIIKSEEHPFAELKKLTQLDLTYLFK